VQAIVSTFARKIYLSYRNSFLFTYFYGQAQKRTPGNVSLRIYDVYATNIRFYLHFQDGNADLQVHLTIMALTVVPSTRVFNGNGESLLIKVNASMEIVGCNRIGNYKRGNVTINSTLFHV